MGSVIVGGGYVAASAIAWIVKLYPGSSKSVVTSWELGQGMAFGPDEEGMLANADYSTFAIAGESLTDSSLGGAILYLTGNPVGCRHVGFARGHGQMSGTYLPEREFADSRDAERFKWQECVCPVVDLVNYFAPGGRIAFGKVFWRFSGVMSDVVAGRIMELFQQGAVELVADFSEMCRAGVSPSAVVDATGLRERSPLQVRVPVVRAGINDTEWSICNASFLADDYLGSKMASPMIGGLYCNEG